MISSVALHNFMKYHHIEFQFGLGINAITGLNDQGKSTILAAIAWIIWGKPTGDAVESWENQERFTWAELGLSNDIFVRRIRHRGAISYEVRKGEEIQEYNATGAGAAPQEILDLIGLQEDINFQGQANNIFPFQLSPNALGNLINERYHLGDIHETVSRLSKELKRNTTKRKEEQTKLKEQKANYEALNWIPKVEGLLDGGDRIQQEIQNQSKKIQKARQLIPDIQSLEEGIQNQSEFIQELKPIQIQAHSCLVSIQQAARIIKSGREKIRDIQWEQSRINQYEKRTKTDKLVKEAKKILVLIQETKKQGKQGRMIMAQIRTETANIKRSEQGLNDNKDRIENIRKSLPPICPLCGK